MILLKNWKFLNAFFLRKKGLLKVLGFCSIKQRSISELQKCRFFKSWKNGYFPKGLTHGLEQKSKILKSFVLGQEKRSIKSVSFICYIEKKSYLNYKIIDFFMVEKLVFFNVVNPWFW